jgi:hypothetical protein
MEVTLTEDGITVISGTVADQSALHGLLAKVRDLGLPLVSVQRIQNKTHFEKAFDETLTKFTIRHE